MPRRLLRPQSPFPRLSEVCHVCRMRERGAGWRVLRIRSEYSLPLTFTKKRKRGRPSGPACCFVFGYQLGTGVPPWGPTPHPDPAVHSFGMTALHWAAYYGNRRIVGLLVASGADVNAQNRVGCAVSAAANRRSAPAESPPPSAVQADAAALCRGQWQNRRHRRAAAMRRRRGRPGQIRRVTLRCAAQPNRNRTAARAQAHAEAMGGATVWEARGVRGGGEPGANRPPPHAPPPSQPRAPSLPALLAPTDVLSALAAPVGREAAAHAALAP